LQQTSGTSAAKSSKDKYATLIYFCEFTSEEETKNLLKTLKDVHEKASRTAE
jgi:hypothetical protein